MPASLAKTMAVVSALLLLATLAVLYVTSRPPAGTREVVAEFRNAFPLVEGMHVRVDGAVAGSVGTIEVSDEGLARVTLLLSKQIEAPRADATAAIRQQDTTGDSYLAFEPGRAGKPLPDVDGKPTIECRSKRVTDPCTNSLVAPRFDDLLNAFGPRERAGVELILTELSRALDRRGTDLNAAALDLRPALVAANEALREVNSQNAALRPLIEDAEAVTGQAAEKREELAGLIESFETTLSVTASESSSLDAGLERLPRTLGRAQPTLAALTRAAVAGRPLAQDLAAAAPGLATALERAPAFFDNAGAAVERTWPTLRLTRRLVRAGAPTIEADPTRVVTGAFDLAPAISNLLTGTLGDATTIKGLFGDDSGGVGRGTLDNFGLGAVTVEPGNQVGYPPSHANRNFFRISTVFNCTMFGIEVRPGCLTDFLNSARRGGRAAAPREAPAPRRRSPAGSERPAAPRRPPAEPPRRRRPSPSRPRPGLKVPGLGELPEPGGGGSGKNSLDDLLDYLLGP